MLFYSRSNKETKLSNLRPSPALPERDGTIERRRRRTSGAALPQPPGDAPAPPPAFPPCPGSVSSLRITLHEAAAGSSPAAATLPAGRGRPPAEASGCVGRAAGEVPAARLGPGTRKPGGRDSCGARPLPARPGAGGSRRPPTHTPARGSAG